MNTDALIRRLEQSDPYPSIGLVEQMIGLVIESRGPKAGLNDVCVIETENPSTPHVLAEVVGFREGKLLLMPLGDMGNLSPGARVRNTGQSFRISVGPELMGRVLDGLGQPLDDRFEMPRRNPVAVQSHAPHPLRRKEITEPISLGIRAIDGFVTVGFGQRVGIFAGSGIGKSTTLGMIARNTEAD